nr:MAG TPA: hypothetical protein [Caudoviricetes sp.]
MYLSFYGAVAEVTLSASVAIFFPTITSHQLFDYY